MTRHYSQFLHYTSDLSSGYERVRVDSAQTGFFEGREFRSYYEFSIPTATALVAKFECPVDFILFNQKLSVDAGGVRLSVHAGGTEGGVFTTVPILGKNRMTERRRPYYTAQATLAAGGTHTGGTEVDVARDVAPGSGSNTSTISGDTDGERGLPAGTYYLKLAALGAGTAAGVYSLWWEERAVHPDWR